jgi:ATP-dependent Clp protease protease subunit
MTAPDPTLIPISAAAAPAQLPPFYVSFSAEVDTVTAEGLLNVCAQIAMKGHPELHLLLSTPGGQVMSGINIYNVLRSLPLKVVTYNVGNVDSIGNVIFLAGAERYACPNATFMFHGVGMNVNQGARLEEKKLRELLQGCQADNARIAAIIEQHASFPDRAEIDKLFFEQQSRDATFAKTHGIAHDVRDVKIPNGAPIHQCVFQRKTA